MAYVKTRRAATYNNKSALYQAYPQLVSPETNACIQGISQLLINMYTEEHYSKMVSSSMHDLDDLGSQYLCDSGDMSEWATYTTMMLNITHMPTALISGLCMPKACTPEALYALSDDATNKINNFLAKLQHKFGMFNFTDQTTGFIRNFTEVQFTLTESDVQLAQWRDSLRAGFILALLLVSCFLTLFFLLPNVYLLTRRVKEVKPALPSKVEWAYQEATMYKNKEVVKEQPQRRSALLDQPEIRIVG